MTKTWLHIKHLDLETLFFYQVLLHTGRGFQSFKPQQSPMILFEIFFPVFSKQLLKIYMS